MANKLNIGELVYKISGDMDNLKAEIKKSEVEISKLKASMDNTNKSTNTFTDSLKTLAKGLGLAYLTSLIVNFGKQSLQAFANAQQSMIQFNNAQENVAGTTKEQIADMNEFVLALEQKTTVDDKAIRQASQILAQDQIKIENQKKILAGIVDISVANAKANGSEVDTQGTAIAVGRAMATGDLGGLTRQNIVGIDETTSKTFKLGNETQRTAIMMKLLEENGKGAGEELGKSFQGSINRAKDTVEDLQVAIGKGLSGALTVFGIGLSDTVGGLKDTTQATNGLGVAFVYVAGLANFMVNSFKLMGLGVIAFGNLLVKTGVLGVAFGKDLIGIFKEVGSSVLKINQAFNDVKSGDFKKASEDLKGAFDFKGSVDNTKKAFDDLLTSNDKIAKSVKETTESMKGNLETMGNAKSVYQQVTKEQDKLTEAKDATNKATQKEKELTADAKKEIETLRGKVLDLRKATDDLAVSLGDKLSEAVNKFKDSTKSIVEESAKSFADIVIKAESDIKDLKKQLLEEQSKDQDSSTAKNIKSLNDEIAEKQRILTSSANFQNDLIAKSADIQKQSDEAKKALETETDPAKKAGLSARVEGLNMEIDALKGFSDLDKQIADARKLAGEDEFKQAEITTFAKLDLATKLFIEETSKLREKQAIALDVESQITAFYKSQTGLRQKTLDTFATNAITQLRRVGEEARSAMSALNEARSAGIQISNPTTPTIPTTIGSSTSTPSTTNNSKTVNSPITINAKISDGLDVMATSKELAFQLSNK